MAPRLVGFLIDGKGLLSAALPREPHRPRFSRLAEPTAQRIIVRDPADPLRDIKAS
jgi:hypothetical protein